MVQKGVQATVSINVRDNKSVRGECTTECVSEGHTMEGRNGTQSTAVF